MVPESENQTSPSRDASEHRQHQWREEEEDGIDGPAHHPAAPADELFDIPTTVDPSYIISLIRSLLPQNVKRDSAHGGNGCHESPRRSKIEFAEGDASATQAGNGVPNFICHSTVSMDTENNAYCQSPREGTGQDESLLSAAERLAREEAWEDSGCILWDLAANKSHAEFMVENLVLEVLLASFLTSDSARITEITIGIIGNLACHEGLMKKIVSTDGMVEAVVDQVFLDDAPCLSEACRLLSLGLGSPERIIWVRALQSDHVLSRILWIVENTLNPQLIEKSSGLLLAALENQQEVLTILLPTLKKLGLLHILVNLLSFEMSKLMTERLPERYPALESILHVIEVMSTIDDYSLEISTNRKLFEMVVKLVKLPDKIEVANSCITATVLIANILTESPDLSLKMSKDFLFLQCLFDLFPLTSDDFEARNAIWSIVARLFVQVQEDEMSSSHIAPYVFELVSRSDLIEDDLLDYQLETTSTQKRDNSTDDAVKLNFRSIALKRISSLLNQWIMVKDRDNISCGENHIADDDVHKLLNCCLRHTSQSSNNSNSNRCNQHDCSSDVAWS